MPSRAGNFWSTLREGLRVAQMFAAALAMVLAGASVAIGAPYEVESVSNGGRIAGQVTFSGTAPAAAPIKTTKNQDYCGMTIVNPVYQIGKGGALGNVEVYIREISKGKAKPTQPVSLANTHCMFQPRVQGACVGQQVKISSDDPILHNTHPQVAADNTTLYNVALPYKGFSVVKRLMPEAGVVRVKCDAHEWMRAWIIELDHPYFATTDTTGKFALSDVPPGKYELVAWHEALGEKTASVTVEAGKPASVNFQFTAK
jgi:hypothetical protein